jgi:hypothetical protein
MDGDPSFKWSDESMAWPNFLVVGTGKSGTTSLCDFLGKHPDIFISDPKEPRFFADDDLYEGKGWEWYEKLFEGAGTAKAIGEGSTCYTVRTGFPKTARRIAESMPDGRMIFIVRHPIDRIVSFYRMLQRRDLPERGRTFDDVVRDPSVRFRHIDRSLYWFQISAYRDYFPDDQILVLFFEDLKSDPNRLLRRCYEFLGVDPDFVAPNLKEQNVAPNVGQVYDWFQPSLLKRIHSLPFYRNLRSIVPKSIRSSTRELIKRAQFSELVEFQVPKPETWSYIVNEISDDIESFLAHYGMPKDYWNFEDLNRFWPKFKKNPPSTRTRDRGTTTQQHLS